MNKARQIGVTIVPKRENQQNINFEVNSPYKRYLNNSLVERYHSDANGDGRINFEDTNAVLQNLGGLNLHKDTLVKAKYSYDKNSPREIQVSKIHKTYVVKCIFLWGGNLIRDWYKDMDLEYNILNQPSQIKVRSEKLKEIEVKNQYLADGTLLSREIRRNDTSFTTHYQGLFTYNSIKLNYTEEEALNLVSVAHAEGKIQIKDKSKKIKVENLSSSESINFYPLVLSVAEVLSFNYEVRDHLGNTRVIFNQD
jgi:hypothetical protein